jgi:hypothetical protein
MQRCPLPQPSSALSTLSKPSAHHEATRKNYGGRIYAVTPVVSCDSPQNTTIRKGPAASGVDVTLPERSVFEIWSIQPISNCMPDPSWTKIPLDDIKPGDLINTVRRLAGQTCIDCGKRVIRIIRDPGRIWWVMTDWGTVAPESILSVWRANAGVPKIDGLDGLERGIQSQGRHRNSGASYLI